MFNLKTTMVSALLFGGLSALPALAQTTVWTGRNLVFNGGNISGCNIKLESATHTGTTNNVIRVTLLNAGGNPVRVRGEAILTGNNQRVVSPQFSVGIYPNVSAWTKGGNPFEGSLVGTTLTVNLTSCTPI